MIFLGHYAHFFFEVSLFSNYGFEANLIHSQFSAWHVWLCWQGLLPQCPTKVYKGTPQRQRYSGWWWLTLAWLKLWVFRRNSRKQHKHLYFVLPFPSWWNTVNINQQLTVTTHHTNRHCTDVAVNFADTCGTNGLRTSHITKARYRWQWSSQLNSIAKGNVDEQQTSPTSTGTTSSKGDKNL